MATPTRRSFLLAALSVSLTEIYTAARAADSVSNLQIACKNGDVDTVKKLLSVDSKLVNQLSPKDFTPLWIAVVDNRPEIVKLLLAAGANARIASPSGETPLQRAALTVMQACTDPKTPHDGADALLQSVPPVSLHAAGTPLHDVLTQVFAASDIPADVDAGLTVPVTTTLSTSLDTALPLLMRLSRHAGQPVEITLVDGRLKVTLSSLTVTAVAVTATAPTADPRYQFDRKISRAVLEAYLSRSVTHFGLLASSPEPATGCFADDLRMLTNIGAKFIGRCAYAWEPPDDDESHFRLAAERAARVHAADPEMLLQAAVFETAYRKVERIPAPDWVFREFGVPIESRTFRYDAMLYDGGKFRDHWMHDASAPDMSKLETRMWFYYRARRYIDSGCEGIHFGQVHLTDQNDPGHRYWDDMLTRVRRYAAKSARRRMVLCDAHTHGVVIPDGRLLFDNHAWPLRPAESRSGDPARMPCEMRREFGDSIIRHSRGGRTPSGWECTALPYTVEFDNYGAGVNPGKPGGPLPWVWGYDEISWFARIESADRDAFLHYATGWLRQDDPNGFLQMPTRRVLAVPANRQNMYHANRKSRACQGGFGQEDAIKAIWTGG